MSNKFTGQNEAKVTETLGNFLENAVNKLGINRDDGK